MITRAWLFGMLIVGSGCSAATAPVVDAAQDAAVDAPPTCEGPTAYCTLLYGQCCEDTGIVQTCREGVWVCDSCVISRCGIPAIPMFDCTRFALDAVRLDMGVAEYCGLADGG